MTLCVAWIRKTGDSEELVFATDSCLSGGAELWKHGIKLFELPRKDCLLCFTGATERAYTLILNLFSSLNFDGNLTSDLFSLEDVIDYISNIFTQLVKAVKSEVMGNPGDDFRGEARFMFGGWDWKSSKFRIWELFYSGEIESFLHKEITQDNSRNRFYKFMGEVRGGDIDIAKQAKEDLYLLQMDEDTLDDHLDMEPLKILKNFSLDPNIQGIAGSLQIAKVYKSGKVEFFGIIWPSSDGSPSFQGREYSFLNKPQVRYFDSDTFEILNVDLPEKINLHKLILSDDDLFFVQSCYPEGELKRNLSEYERYRLKITLKEVAYSDFISFHRELITGEVY